MFTDDLGEAARLAQHQCRPGLTVRIELDPHGLMIVGDGESHKVGRPTFHNKQMVSYHDAEVSSGRVLAAKISEVVRSLGYEFLPLERA